MLLHKGFIFTDEIIDLVYKEPPMQTDYDLIDKLVSDWAKERPEIDAAPMLVVGRIIQLGKKLERRATLAIQDDGIQYTELDVLATLRRSGHPYCLTPTALGQSVIITSGALTALLNRLERRELISRMPDETDGRVKLACLTALGKELIDRAIVLRFSEAADAINALGSDEKRVLASLLKKMGQDIEP